MSVWMTGGLEPSPYWQNVCALANDLLTETPMRDWTVLVAAMPFTGPVPGEGGTPRWDCRLDLAAKELAVGVPPQGDHLDETDPEDVATYIVFDLLYERVLGDGDGTAGD